MVIIVKIMIMIMMAIMMRRVMMIVMMIAMIMIMMTMKVMIIVKMKLRTIAKTNSYLNCTWSSLARKAATKKRRQAVEGQTGRDDKKAPCYNEVILKTKTVIMANYSVM